MVEGEARFVPEDVIIDALEWGRNEIQPLLDAQEQLRESCGKPKMVFEEPRPIRPCWPGWKNFALDAGLAEAMRVPENWPARMPARPSRQRSWKPFPRIRPGRMIRQRLRKRAKCSEDLEKKIVRGRIVRKA